MDFTIELLLLVIVLPHYWTLFLAEIVVAKSGKGKIEAFGKMVEKEFNVQVLSSYRADGTFRIFKVGEVEIAEVPFSFTTKTYSSGFGFGVHKYVEMSCALENIKPEICIHISKGRNRGGLKWFSGLFLNDYKLYFKKRHTIKSSSIRDFNSIITSDIAEFIENKLPYGAVLSIEGGRLLYFTSTSGKLPSKLINAIEAMLYMNALLNATTNDDVT